MPRTDTAWARHAQRCTLKRLEVEVRWHEAKAARLATWEYDRLTHGGMPQPQRRMEDLRLDALELLGLQEHALGPKAARRAGWPGCRGGTRRPRRWRPPTPRWVRALRPLAGST